jgi:hypothetical protein
MSDFSSAAERIASLEAQLEAQSTQVQQLMSLLSSQMSISNSPPISIDKPLVSKTPKVTKVTQVEVDETRAALISQITELGFKKSALQVEKLSNEQLQKHISSLNDNFCDFDLLTTDGLLQLCNKRSIVAKKSMSREVLISKLTGDDIPKPDVSDVVLTRASLRNLTLVELKTYCKDNGIKGYSTKKKDELIELILS